MRILAVCPLPRLKDHFLYFSQSIDTILCQDFDGEIDYYMQSGDVSGGDRYDRVTMKYERARWMFLDGTWDAMWCVEYDMLVPPDALTKLTQVKADIAYGLYCWRWSPFYWSAYDYLGQDVGISLSQKPEVAREAWGNVVEVAGVGQGCTLIQRHVLEKITFHREGLACGDWYMARDATRLGLSQRCDTSIVCGHTGLTPRPFTVWPTIDTPGLYRIDLVDYPVKNKPDNPFKELSIVGSLDGDTWATTPIIKDGEFVPDEH